MSTHIIAPRLARLRAALQRHRLSGVLLLSSDPHLSEYLPEHWQGREWASGFTGSMGTLVVLQDQAALFTDSRYWVQAEQELQGSGIDLVKLGQPGAPSPAEWIASHSQPNDVFSIDGRTLGLNAHQDLQQKLAARCVKLRLDVDLLDEVWPDRPPLSNALVYEHLPPHACVSRQTKLEGLRADLLELHATHHLISALDDIAWLFNLRGNDVDYNPVFLAHALISATQAQLFVAPNKIPPALHTKLHAEGIEIHAYDAITQALAALPADSRVLLDPRRVTVALKQALPAQATVKEALNPCVRRKSRKTEAEAAHVREVMARDGAAMAHFYAWFEQALGKTQITELTVDERLSAERARQPEFVSLSFPTIAGFNANGALPHYRALPQAHAVISTPTGLAAEGLLLIDSGGQYLGGTTDITRVWAIGHATPLQRRDFTLVLKGMIALSRARFPLGTLSPMLDALARAPLWDQGLDFGHGTGHGVGYFLNVHEGPQSISKALPNATMAFHAGMITSNEPGLYRAGQWGVRIENLLLTVPSPLQEMDEFLAFETLTLCPIDTHCIELFLLRDDELDWLNRYHAEVRERVRPLLQGDARAWLDARTQALTR
jgi:Xaa-Pro aminopeptidase